MSKYITSGTRRRAKLLRACARQNFLCHWCGRPLMLAELMKGDDGYWGRWFRRATLDHLVHGALGGSNADSNLVASCPPCNHERADNPQGVLDRELGLHTTLAHEGRTYRRVGRRWEPVDEPVGEPGQDG